MGMFFSKPKRIMATPDDLLRPLIKVTAVSEVISDYLKDIEAGTKAVPAHKRADASVGDLWRGIRIEALRQLWGFGKSDPGLLAEPTKQLMILTYLYKHELYLKPFAPTGDPVRDSLQSIFQVLL